MDVTFILSAIIFTLLAIVVATSIFKGSSPAAELVNARSFLLAKADRSGLEQNGHVTEKKQKKEVEDWTEISGSSHDHWDVVKSVLSAQEQSHHRTDEAETPEHSSKSSLSVPSYGTRHMSLEVDSSSSMGRTRRSFGLSDTELLKCAFSYPQTEGAAESPEANEKMETSPNNSLKYTPGKARSHHLEMMMSKEELAEEQRVQREQLAAIFQLLKENKETFGDMSEGDLEDQLRLYSI